MPETTTIDKFEVDPAYNENKDLIERINSAQRFLEKELAVIDRITDQTMQLICMFSLLDCLAQEQINYSSKKGSKMVSKKVFCDFVIEHQRQCDYLEKVEPVTLYYRKEDLIEKRFLLPGFPEEPEISLNSLGNLHMKPVKEVICSPKAQEILNYISKKEKAKNITWLQKQHQLISLIYQMRNKVVHEFSGLGQPRVDSCSAPEEPYYQNVGRSYVQKEYWVSDDIYELIIPNTFIRNILQDCIVGYLDKCKKEKRFPFENNNMTRKHWLTWYDNDASSRST